MWHDGRARRIAVIGGLRIPFCRAHTEYAACSNQDMMTGTLRALVQAWELKDRALGDVALGAVIKHSRDWNLARESVIGSGLAPTTPGVDLQRACGTSLEACILIGNKIALGQIEAGIAGGTDSVSDSPIVYPDDYRSILLGSHRGRSLGERLKPWLRLRPRHFKPELPGVVEPRTNLSMGESTEITAKAFGITRERQDQLALASHRNAAQAWDEGFYQDLVVPFRGATRDNNIRRDTSFEKLAKLKPVFGADQREADAGAVGIAGPGREQDRGRVHRHGRGHVQRIVAPDQGLDPELAQIMHQIVGKAVVVVDQQQHSGPLRVWGLACARPGAIHGPDGQMRSRAVRRACPSEGSEERDWRGRRGGPGGSGAVS